MQQRRRSDQSRVAGIKDCSSATYQNTKRCDYDRSRFFVFDVIRCLDWPEFTYRVRHRSGHAALHLDAEITAGGVIARQEIRLAAALQTQWRQTPQSLGVGERGVLLVQHHEARQAPQGHQQAHRHGQVAVDEQQRSQHVRPDQNS